MPARRELIFGALTAAASFRPAVAHQTRCYEHVIDLHERVPVGTLVHVIG